MKLARESAYAASGLLVVAAALVGCDGGTGAPPDVVAPAEPRILSIYAEPGGELWNWNGGSPVVPATSVELKLNASITFVCNGAIAAGAPGPSLPALVATAGGDAAVGDYTVEDDPALPAGNRRRLVFRPTFNALIPAWQCAGGLVFSTNYVVAVPQGRFGVDGLPLGNAATTGFVTTPCVGAVGGAFADPAPGPAYVMSSAPPASDPPPGTYDANLLYGITLVVLLSEPLDPSSIPSPPFRIQDVASGAIVTGFGGANFDVDAAHRTRLFFLASQPFAAGRTYEFLLDPALRDFGGNVVETSPANDPGPDGLFGTPDDGPQHRLLFTTAGGLPVAHGVGESFDDVSRKAGTSGATQWNGDGRLAFGDLSSYVGDGSDGPFTAAAGVTAMNTDQTIVVNGANQSRKGVWNFSSLTVPAGATLRFHGPWPVHLGVLGAAQIDGVLDASAGAINPATLGANPAYEAGPRTGANDNGGVSGPATISGGVGNGGGGQGGKASANDQSPSPGNWCPSSSALHSYYGETGYGPSLTGVPNASATDPAFAGGGGGRSGFFPGAFAGEQGGFGGAGGSSATVGEAGVPRVITGCAPATLPICSAANGGNNLPLAIAQSGPITALFIPPIAAQSAGSGGGGGGDKLQTGGTPPGLDEQGGGGGGGGGSIRIASLGALGLGATAVIKANGAVGAGGATLAGNGGSGSGGEIWLQSFLPATISATASMSVAGGARFGGTSGATGCGIQAAGAGGQGLVQIETPSNAPPPAAPATSAGAVVQIAASFFGATISGVATSTFLDSGFIAPTWTGAVEAVNLGGVPGATLTIVYEGAHALIDGSGPDLTTLKSTVDGTPGGAPITAATLNALDGRRYIRFRATASLPTPVGAPYLASLLPYVDSISLNFVTH